VLFTGSVVSPGATAAVNTVVIIFGPSSQALGVVTTGAGRDELAARLAKVLESISARAFDTVIMPVLKGGGFSFRSPSRPQALVPPQVIAQRGFSHLPGLHFQAHTGCAHLLSHCSAHSVEQTDGLQTVLHFGQLPCSQCPVGQITAHEGGGQRTLQVDTSIDSHAVSHCGGAQTGSQTSSQSALPQLHQHFG
jgi:hypothetical protein